MHPMDQGLSHVQGPFGARGGVSGLVAGAVFKTVERQALSLAGSIPVRLRRSAARAGQW
jgi:hypothetical protein